MSWPFFIIACIGLVIADAHAHAITLQDIVRRYHTVETGPNTSFSDDGTGNDDGRLAWNESYVLSSRLDIYEATSDPGYLVKFAVDAQKVIEETDEARGVRDYKGRSRIGWSSVAYSRNGQRVMWLVHTAMITYPLARFTLMVQSEPRLHAYSSLAHKCLEISKEALGEFDQDWRYDTHSGEGYHTFEADHPDFRSAKGSEVLIPFNMGLAAGRVAIILWQATDDERYRAVATAVARSFRHHLALDTDGGYRWRYAGVSYGSAANPEPSPIEDVGHGAIDVSFVVLAAQAGIGFQNSDLERFARAYFRYTTASLTPLERSELGMWISLAVWSCSVYLDLLPKIMGEPANLAWPTAISGLALYSRRCLGD